MKSSNSTAKQEPSLTFTKDSQREELMENFTVLRRTLLIFISLTLSLLNGTLLIESILAGDE